MRVHVAPATAGIPGGDTVRFRASLLDAEGRELSGRRVVWARPPQTLATMDSTGMATVVAPPRAVNVLAGGNSSPLA